MIYDAYVTLSHLRSKVLYILHMRCSTLGCATTSRPFVHIASYVSVRITCGIGIQPIIYCCYCGNESVT